jgi:hypothetical protein
MKRIGKKNEKMANSLLDLYQQKVFDVKEIAKYMQNHPEVAVEVVIEMARRNKNGQMTDEEAMKLMMEYEKLRRGQEQPALPEGKGKRIQLDFSDEDAITPPTFTLSVKPSRQI